MDARGGAGVQAARLALPRRQSISAEGKYTHKPRAEQIYLLASTVRRHREAPASQMAARRGGRTSRKACRHTHFPCESSLTRSDRIKTEPSAIRSYN